MSGNSNWDKEIAGVVTVTDAQGTITWMNDLARKHFGGDLTGQSVFDCHPEPSRTTTVELYKRQTPNHYTTEQTGKKTMVHQMPLFRNGVFDGYVELGIPLPKEVPNKVRGK